MNAMKMHQKQIVITLALLCAIASIFSLAIYSYAKDETKAGSLTYTSTPSVTLPGSTQPADKNGQYYGSSAALAQNYTNTYIVVKQKQLGGSHYAYTEGVSDDYNSGYPNGNEMNFRPGSALVKLTLTPNGSGVTTKEETLISKPSGVIRDPDVSPDGKTLIFSMKESATGDDFHLYLYHLDTGKQEQITFGQGIADIEPKFLPDGGIVFSSTRDEQRVDCWKTVVSNLYRCDADGSNIVRLGYDQVHTTYPTVTQDGRVLYTRWDYNDRNQMYVQGVFQMFQDGTKQTELYGNDINWPTCLLHTRDIYGSANKYITIVSGHHVNQGGKLAFINLDKGSNSADAIEFIFEDSYTKNHSSSQDANMMNGYIYKYPYAVNDKEILFARTATASGLATYGGENTVFNIYYYNTETKELTTLVNGTSSLPASQICPVVERNVFNRASNVDYSSNTGTYYVANVYEGEGTPGVKAGSAAYIRVVALEFRPYAVGAIVNPQITSSQSDDRKYYAGSDPHTPVGSSYTSWDVKRVLGIAKVYPDGSALFNVPSETPVYFQLLDKDYNLIQSMRSWSTLQRGENFSCIGCHESSGLAPTSTSVTTMAMAAGVQDLQPDLWMNVDAESFDPADTKGFSYLENIQPILNKSCIKCHTNLDKAYSATSTDDVSKMTALVNLGDTWNYKITSELLNASAFAAVDSNITGWSSGKAAFGTAGDAREPSVCNSPNVDWSSGYGYFRREFTLTAEQAASKTLTLYWQYDENPVVYINGKQVLTTGAGVYTPSPKMDEITISAGTLKEGKNVIAVRLENKLGGRYFDLALYTNAGKVEGKEPISLESTAVRGPREKMNYAISYLVLTGSKKNGDYYLGNYKNKYTNWISAISQCEILDPYQYGSSKSELLKLLRNESTVFANHPKLDLTEAEIAAFSCWIDLACPFRGSYNEAESWSAADYRTAEELQIKQDYYNTLDNATKDVLGGLRDGESEITVTYTGSKTYTLTGSGVVNLYVPSQYTANSRITIQLPEGQEYAYVGINSRLKPQLVYARNGSVTLTLTSQMLATYPSTVRSYTKNNIYVWLPTEEELAEEYNLAYTPFTGSGVTVSASDSYPGNEFAPQNAVDGYRNNNGHGAYPVQSWGPNENPANLTYTVNFGRTVTVDHLMLYIRADFDHDTYITSVTATFTDEEGNKTSKTFTGLEKTDAGQLLQLDAPVNCVSVQLSKFVKARATWFAISELEVYGTNYDGSVLPSDDLDVDGDHDIDIQDVTALLNYLAGMPGNYVERGLDVNRDGKVTIADVSRLLAHLADENVRIY